MTPEKQRIAIAEALGKKVNPDVGEYCPSCRFGHGEGHASFCAYVPNYPQDLNAMHEALSKLLGHRAKTLSLEETRDVPMQRKFEVELYSVIRRDDGLNDHYLIEMYRCSNASAAQLAEAFLSTIGKWEESA